MTRYSAIALILLAACPAGAAEKTVELGSFSPDGRWITFSRFSGNSPYSTLFAMRTDGTDARRMSKSDANYSPDWGRPG